MAENNKHQTESGSDSQLPAVKSDDVIVTGGGLNSFGPTAISLKGLTEEQKQALIIKHGEGSIKVEEKAKNAMIGLGVFDKKMDTMAETSKQVNDQGISITSTISHKDDYGGVDVIMGNTDEASKGKVPKNATANFNSQLLMIGFIGFVVVVTAVVLIKLLGS